MIVGIYRTLGISLHRVRADYDCVSDFFDCIKHKPLALHIMLYAQTVIVCDYFFFFYQVLNRTI